MYPQVKLEGRRGSHKIGRREGMGKWNWGCGIETGGELNSKVQSC